MDRRYQVFVSSTYADLKEERRGIIQTVVQMDCIPAGMELFPAADEEQFMFIKKVIDDCDYYLLIIAGRYGTTDADGISYTEKEYDYAVSRRLKVIAFIHESPDEIPLGKSETDPMLRERLRQFRDKVATNRLVKFWKSAEELPGLVALSLANTLRMFPAVGWVRADKMASEDLLREINELRKQNDQLQATVTELRSEPTINNLASLQDKMQLDGTYRDRWSRASSKWTASLTWSEIFACIAPYLARFPTDTTVKSILTLTAFGRSDREGDDPYWNDQQFRTVAVQLQALGFVRIEYAQTTTASMDLFWSITPAGQRLMLELRTVRSAAASGANKKSEEPK
ncbi:MAG TPA: DUF4062 domain-containing protein [Candidatus Limnocylindrales bacterium]|nr:DUF4062 domain-containing protein [Candidatus Limnocylindrales bacterium]